MINSHTLPGPSPSCPGLLEDDALNDLGDRDVVDVEDNSEKIHDLEMMGGGWHKITIIPVLCSGVVHKRMELEARVRIQSVFFRAQHCRAQGLVGAGWLSSSSMF